jgi:hypothetical protein
LNPLRLPSSALINRFTFSRCSIDVSPTSTDLPAETMVRCSSERADERLDEAEREVWEEMSRDGGDGMKCGCGDVSERRNRRVQAMRYEGEVRVCTFSCISRSDAPTCSAETSRTGATISPLPCRGHTVSQPSSWSYSRA